MKQRVIKPSKSKTIFIYRVSHNFTGNIESMLNSEGINTIYSENILDLFDYLKFRLPDAVIFDIASSKLNSSTITGIRKLYPGIIILLTERKDAKYHINNLKIGIDEVFNKSIDIKVLTGRIKFLIDQQEYGNYSMNKTIKIGEIKINSARREVFLDDKILNINSVEFDILWYLITNTGKTVSRDELHRALYNSEYNGIERALDIYVSRIRSKLCDNPRDPKYIKTVRGEGYLFLPL
jgi:two-component system response regulator RstA